jgi:hypothetical protein
MALEPFARDLGYLDTFFDKLEAHATALSPAAGARLRVLMSEERARWGEIRGLLGGAAPAAGAPAARASEARPVEAARPAAGAPARAEPPRITVGSLIERKGP